MLQSENTRQGKKVKLIILFVIFFEQKNGSKSKDKIDLKLFYFLQKYCMISRNFFVKISRLEQTFLLFWKHPNKIKKASFSQFISSIVFFSLHSFWAFNSLWKKSQISTNNKVGIGSSLSMYARSHPHKHTPHLFKGGYIIVTNIFINYKKKKWWK